MDKFAVGALSLLIQVRITTRVAHLPLQQFNARVLSPFRCSTQSCQLLFVHLVPVRLMVVSWSVF